MGLDFSNLEELPLKFFQQDALDLAPRLLGKWLFRRLADETVVGGPITELEVYRGCEDLACHASKGLTKRTQVMFEEGGKVYVYLIYGRYWLCNIVTGPRHHPQAILIRSLQGINGPGRVGQYLQLNKNLYGESLSSKGQIWVAKDMTRDSVPIYKTGTRIGIAYAKEWAMKPWRFYI